MSLADHLERVALAMPNHIAMRSINRPWSYPELNAIADRIASGLVAIGIQPGDRVALQLANSPELVMAYYGCFRAGAIAVPVNNRFAPQEILYSLRHSDCRAVITQPDLFRNLLPVRKELTSLRQVFLAGGSGLAEGTRPFSDLSEYHGSRPPFPRLRDDDVAAILYTSGTTARPKGVTHTHGTLTATCEFHGGQIGLNSSDIICVIPPMCHILGFATQLVAGIHAGATLIVMPDNEPQTILGTIHEHRVTRIAGLPVMFQSLVNEPGTAHDSLASLKTCIAGGDAVPVALQEEFLRKFGVTIYEGCGMTEVIPFTLNVAEASRIGSIGRACPGMTIRLIDDHGRDVAADEPGEILVQSRAAMTGYWLEPEITAATLADGFVHTGDLARCDRDGFYWFVGRKKEIIIRGGSNISPLEVEEVLYQHPAVRECGVVGVPSPSLGETVQAFVAFKSGMSATEQELQAFLVGKISGYKIPERIVFLDVLPKGLTGKINRRLLKDQA